MKFFKKFGILTVLAIATATLASFSSTTFAMEALAEGTQKIEQLTESTYSKHGIFDCYMDDIKYHNYKEATLLKEYDLTQNEIYSVVLSCVYNLSNIINDRRTRFMSTIKKELASNETYQKLLEQFATCFEKFIYGNNYNYSPYYKIENLLNKLINKYTNKCCTEYDDYVEQFVKQYPDSDIGKLLKYLNDAHKCTKSDEYINNAKKFFDLYNKYFKKYKEFDKLSIIIHNEHSIKKFNENITKHINLLINEKDLTKEETLKKYEDMQEILTHNSTNINKNLLDLKYHILTSTQENKNVYENLIKQMEELFQETSKSLEKMSSSIPKKETLVKEAFNFLKNFLNNNEKAKDNESESGDNELKNYESKNNDENLKDNKSKNEETFNFLYNFINNDDESKYNGSEFKTTKIIDEYARILKNIKTMHEKIVEPFNELQKKYFEDNKVF